MRGIVTIDGPSASGKSSVARRVAAALGVPYLSSGLLYRAAAFLALRAGVDPGDEEGLLALLEGLGVRLLAQAEGNRVLADGEDLTSFLHTPEVDRVVSAVARLPGVRAWVNRRRGGAPGKGPRPTRRCSGTSSGGTSGTRRKAPPLPTPSSWTPGG